VRLLSYFVLCISQIWNQQTTPPFRIESICGDGLGIAGIQILMDMPCRSTCFLYFLLTKRVQPTCTKYGVLPTPLLEIRPRILASDGARKSEFRWKGWGGMGMDKGDFLPPRERDVANAEGWL
jgi:hypothetical protein